jgi:hypothetical protein
MADLELVREAFYTCTPAEGTPKQKRDLRQKQFIRALAWAEDNQLIAVHEIGDITYLRLTRPNSEEDNVTWSGPLGLALDLLDQQGAAK